MDFFDRHTTVVRCPRCDWEGTAESATRGESFRELYEADCPTCDGRVAIISYPTGDEVRAAAATGDAEGKEMLAQMEERERWWERVVESRKSPVVLPPSAADGPVDAVLSIVGEDDVWLVLKLNGEEAHRELAVFESTEPAERLLDEMCSLLGDRLRKVDYLSATVYLYGDRHRSVDELKNLFEDYA